MDVEDAGDLNIEAMATITRDPINTGVLGDAASDDDPVAKNITVAAMPSVAQAVLTVNAVDHDRKTARR